MVKVKRVQNRRLKPPQAEKKFCAFLHRRCTRPRLDGHLYCMSHILEDKSAPFRQCTYVHPSNRKRCTNAAPKNDKYESLCPFHVKLSRFVNLPKSSTKRESENLLKLMSQLEHYCDDRRHNPTCDRDDDFYDQFTTVIDSVDSPEMSHMGSGSVPGQKTRISESWMGHSDVSESDTDCSDDDEPLKHAGVYTYEEVARIYRDKLIQLQTLYIEEMKYLQYNLSEKRRDFLKSLKNEKRTQGSIHSTMPRSTKDERDRYLLFRALKRYHHSYGSEALLRDRSVKRRLESSGSAIPQRLLSSDKITLCTFVDDDNGNCKNKALPLTKYCCIHILSDSQQVLFQQCPGGSTSCPKVVVPCSEDTRCILHSCPEPPPQKQRSLSPIAGPSGLQNIGDANQEQEHFQAMDDIASLGLDAVVPGCLFGLNQFGELDDESTDSCMTYDSRGGAYIYPEGYHDDVMMSDAPSDTS